MVLFKIRISGKCVGYREYRRGYLEKFEVYENVINLDYLLFGFLKVYSKTVFKEDVPEFVVTCYNCYGDCGGWVSKRPKLVSASNQKRVIKTILI